MRIVVVGDFHLDHTPIELSRQAMRDIARVAPDQVIALGDYGDRDHIGTPEGLRQAFELLKFTDAPVLPLLGNHDLQNEIGRNSLPHGTMEQAARGLWGVKETSFVLENDFLRIIGVSLTSWTCEYPLSPNECHVSKKSFNRICRALSMRSNVPTLILTHAPPMGCGLQTVPSVHVRATNAYMDQNTSPLRWLRLTQHPEIVLWLSGHYHLGHDAPDALIERQGVTYALTGVHGNVSRDGTRQSRVLDISESGVAQLYTLDHITGNLRDKPDWTGMLPSCVSRRTSCSNRLEPSRSIKCMQPLLPIGPGGVQTLPNGHLLMSTEDGFLWEIDPEWDCVLGTLHFHEGKLDGYLVCGEYIWRCFGNTLCVVRFNDPWRFSREYSDDHRRDMRYLLPAQATEMNACGDGINVKCGQIWLHFDSPVSFNQ